MTVYVDELKRGWCHMTADSVRELHEMAAVIGMKRRWFQNHRFKHYDLRATKRAAAIFYGAREVTSRDMVLALRKAGVSDERADAHKEEA